MHSKTAHILKMSSTNLPLHWQNSTEQQLRIPSEEIQLLAQLKMTFSHIFCQGDKDNHQVTTWKELRVKLKKSRT